MKLKDAPEFYQFLSTSISNTDIETEEGEIKSFLNRTSSELQFQVASQVRLLISSSEIPIDELGAEANRWFGSEEESRDWLRKILAFFEGASSSPGRIVKDSNGVQLNEGDSVIVIKDLKVKGGSSDLKRGTLIKKIHLVDDHEVIECRVGGSTLVLKTCFLKKS